MDETQVRSEDDWEDALHRRLSDGESLFLLCSGIENGLDEGRRRLAAILRSLSGEFPERLRILLCGGERLAELKFAPPEISLLNIAEPYFLPEPSTDDLREWYAQDFGGEPPEEGELALGEDFPLNMGELKVLVAEPETRAAELLRTLRQLPTGSDPITLVLSPNEASQRELARASERTSRLLVVPQPEDITRLMLSRTPRETLAGLIADAVPLTRISPYQSGDGANKESIFFGRERLLTHVMNRAPANYLVVGGRQLGKSSLLKALARRYADEPSVRCFYLTLAGADDWLRRINRALGLPRDSTLDGLLDHLQDIEDARCLFLLDEADAFVAAERDRDYATLRRLRSLAQEGRANFVLAGFWELYEQSVYDAQSPLRNFGELLRIDALEPDACRALVTEPMRTMNITFEDEADVQRIVTRTGQRANLVAITCNALVSRLPPDRRRVSTADVDAALDSDAVRDALASWDALGGSEVELPLLRLIVFSTINDDRFSYRELDDKLRALGCEVPTDTLDLSLRRLELGFVVGRQGENYYYRVPLFVDMQRALGPQRRARQALVDYRSAVQR